MANTKLPARLLDTSAIPALNVTGDLTVDTTTLKVDSTNNRVGIGIASPSAPLHVGGEAYFDAGTRHYTYDDQANFWSLYTNTDDSFRFNYNGAGADEVVIDSSGNVGIGTATPNASARLHVGKSGASPELWLERTDGYLPTKLIANTMANGQGFKINVAGTDSLAIDSDGNVGIGTSDPDTLLELRKDTASSAYGEYPILSLRNDNVAGYSAIHFQEGSTQRARVEVGNNSGTPYMGLYTTSGASGIIIKDGNVGIGNTAPPEMLTIGSTSDTNVRIQFLSSTTGGNTIHFGDGTSADAYRGYINYTHSDDKLAFAAGGGERLHIGSTGITTLISGQANLGTLQLSSQAATYQLTGGNNLGYLGYKTGGYHRWFGSDGVEEMRLSADQLLIPGHATNGTSPIKIGSATNTEYVDFVLQTNTGTAEIFKAGTGYTGWGGASALNIYNSNEKIAFHPSGQANVVQMTSAGIVMGAGKGISFGNNANYSGMSSEILDDYEEGTWTPTLGTEAVTGSAASNTINAHYVKIGRLVHLTGWFNSFTFSTITSGTYVMVRGLPFRPEHHSTGFKFSYTTSSLAGGTYGYGHTSLYACYILVGGSTGAAVHLTRAGISAPSSDTTHFMFHATYYTED